MAQNKTQAAQNAAKEIEQQLTNGIAAAIQCITVTGKPSTGQANQYYKYQDYTKTWQNYCPLCHKTGTLTDNPKGVYEHEITCDKSKGGCDADFDVTTGADKSGAYRAYLQDANGNSNSKNKVDTTIGDSTSSTTTSSSAPGSYTGYSPLLSGEQSFQQLVAEITNGINVLVLCKRNIIKVTDFETLYAEAKVLRDSNKYVDEDIHLWQLEDGTYTLDVNEYGFFNTVNVVYSGGTVTETYEDLVRVFGVMAKTYYDKTLTKSQAQAKAKAYLAAHIQEFGMEIKCSILHNPAIEIGDIVTLENPMTLRDAVKKANKGLPEYLFVRDMSISWDDGALTETQTEETTNVNIWTEISNIVLNHVKVTEGKRNGYIRRLYLADTKWANIAKIIQGHNITGGAPWTKDLVIRTIYYIKKDKITSNEAFNKALKHETARHSTSLKGH